jgi:alpha-aminoadipate carrier protein LysW
MAANIHISYKTSHRIESEESVMVLCPECDTDLDVDKDELEEGDAVSCAECGTDFEVITTDPLELRPVSDEDDEEEEDKEADEDEDE